MKFLYSLILVLLTAFPVFSQTLNKQLEFNSAMGVEYNSNLVKNPSAFKNDLYATASNAAISRETSVAYIDSVASWKCDSVSIGGYCEFTLIPPSMEQSTGNCKFVGLYQGADGNYYSAQITDVSGTVLNKFDFQTTGAAWTPFEVTYPCGSSGDRKVRITQTTAGTPGAIYVGKLTYASYVGSIIPSFIQEQAYTPTFTGFGTVVTQKFSYAVYGNKLYIQGRFVVATSTAVEARISLPNNLVSAGTDIITSGAVHVAGKANKDNATTTDFSGLTVLIEPSVSYMTMGVETSTTNGLSKMLGNVISSGRIISLSAVIPLAGQGVSQIVGMDQGNYDWIAYTPTFTGFGTATNIECQHSRNMADMLLRCKFTGGTSTATEARISLPNGLLSASTAKIPSIQVAGKYNINSSSSTFFSGGAVLIEPGVGYVTLGQESSTTNGLTKINGSGALGSGGVMSFTARIPIAGWVANGNAQIFKGTDTTSGITGYVEIFSFSYAANSSFNSNCSSSPCFVDQIGTMVTGQTRNSTGNYTAAFAKTFSKLKCNGNGVNTGTSMALFSSIQCTNCNSIVFESATNIGGTAGDSRGTLLCQGQVN